MLITRKRALGIVGALLTLVPLPVWAQGKLVPLQPAEQVKPVASVSFSSIDGVLGSIQYITEAAGQPDMGPFVTMMTNPYMQGMDRTKPVGMVVSMINDEFRPLAFIPVSDMQQVLATMKDQVGEARDAGDGILEMPGPQPTFVKEQKGWAFVGQTVESLRSLPENPTAPLKDLPTTYDIAIRAQVQNIPKQYVDMAVSTLKDGIRQGLQEVAEEDRAAQEELMQAQMKQIETFIREADEITIGWKADPAEKRTYLDMGFTAVPGGELAKQMASLADAKSDYAGFMLPDAAMTMNMSAKIPADQIQTNVDVIENLKRSAMKEIQKDDKLKSPEARAAAQELLGSVLDVLIETVKSGSMDGGASVVLKPKAMQVVAGFQVANGKDVENILKKVVEMSKNESDFPGIKFNADSKGDTQFHTMTVPIPAEEKAREFLGNALTIAVGVAPKSTYIGIGADCVAQLKSIIGATSKQQPVPPFQMNVALTPILEFARSIDANPMIGSVADAVKAAPGKDRVKLHALPIKSGFIYRIELEEGVLKAIGQGIAMGNAGGF